MKEVAAHACGAARRGARGTVAAFWHLELYSNECLCFKIVIEC